MLEKMHNIIQKQEIQKSKYQKNSLNESFRKQRYDKLNHENRTLLERLKNKQSTYSARNYANDRKVIENRLLMISHFQNKTKTSPKPKNRKKITEILDPRKLIYEKKTYIDKKCIIVEIYQYPTNIKIIAIEEESSSTYRLIISHEDCYQITEGLQNWDNILRCLDIEGELLVLKF